MPVPSKPCTCIARRQTPPGKAPFDPRCPTHGRHGDRSTFTFEHDALLGPVTLITTRHDPTTWEVLVWKEGAERGDYLRGLGTSRTSAREQAGLEVDDA